MDQRLSKVVRYNFLEYDSTSLKCRSWHGRAWGAVTCRRSRRVEGCSFVKTFGLIATPLTFQPIAIRLKTILISWLDHCIKEGFQMIETKQEKFTFANIYIFLLYFLQIFAVINWLHCNDSVSRIMWLIGWIICMQGTYIEHELLDVFLQIRNESRLMALDLPLMVLLCAFSDPPPHIDKKKSLPQKKRRKKITSDFQLGWWHIAISSYASSQSGSSQRNLIHSHH